jgi:uncharacterized protein YggE
MPYRYLLPILVAFVAASPALAQTASQEERREPLLTVLGSGSYEVKPDLAYFQAVVSTSGKTLDAATAPHQERATRALKVLQDLQADGLEIEKSNFSVDERRGQRPIPPIQPGPGQRTESFLKGYTATTHFDLKTGSIEKVDQIVTKIAASGLFQIESIRFGVVQERAALNQARRSAMLDARDQAQAYADPVDLELEQIVAITDGEARAPDGAADLPSRPRSGSYTVQILPPAKLEFTASVNVTWRIAPRKAK